MQENWEGLEKPLRQLVTLVKKQLSASEQREILDYISSNELEAAMEALVDILVDKKEPLPKQVLNAAEKLASALDLPHELSRITKNLTLKS